MKNVTILFHNVEYSLWNDDNNDVDIEISDYNEDYIKEKISKWFREGELTQLIDLEDGNEEEIHGYWKILFKE